MAAPHAELELVDAEGDLILEVGDPSPSPTQATSPKQENGSPDKADDEGNNSDQSQELGDNHGGVTEQAADADLEEKDEISYLRILVCSKVLIWTSAVFRQMLNGPFVEAQQVPDAQGRRTLRLPEDDPSSTLEICNILHHKICSSNQKYPFDQLHGLAILCDKYNFKSALYSFFSEELGSHLPGVPKQIASGLTSDAPTLSAKILEMAFLAGIGTVFGQAAIIYAYTQLPDQIAYGLHGAFKNTPMPEGLLARIYTLQHHIMRRYAKIPTEILNEMTSDIINGHESGTPEGVRHAITAGSGWPPLLCDGVIKQLGVATAFLADKKLFREMHTRSVEEYALCMGICFRGAVSPGASCFCSNDECETCRGRSRPDLMSIAQNKLQHALSRFWDGQICLQFVQENRPLEKYENACTIH